MRRREMKASSWNRIVIGGTLSVLALMAAAVAVVDPFLHYHKPLAGMQYPLKDERYQNDGILRHYEYTAVISGTSMTQNFRASQFEELWGEKTVKTAFSGASFKEVSDALERAFSYNKGIKYVVRSLDGSRINYLADRNEYEGYPEYLYDRNPFNDTEYLLNKEVATKLLAVVNYTRAGNIMPTMDEYGSWGQYKVYGRDEVFRTLPQLGEFEEEVVLSDEDRAVIAENIQKNVLELALAHPGTVFYVFVPPYSICYWQALVQTKQLNAQLETELMAVELLLQADNIRVFCFADEVDMIADLDNYTDSLHYGPWVNDRILQWMYDGEHELTKDNCREYYDMVRELYLNYPYDQGNL